MKKLYFTLMALLSLSWASAQAQTILEEDFETGTTASAKTPLTRGSGWTTVNSYSGNDYTNNWYNYYSDPESATAGPTISGAHAAACDGKSGGGEGPREEILLSPELTLDDTYQLQFSWKVSPQNAMDNYRYDLQVRVVTGDDLAGAETVFSIQSEQMLRESGVTVFPIDTWEVHTSKVDLSDWKGEKVKLAFVYKMLTTQANIVWLDDITVKQFTPATGPVAQLSIDRYDFKDVYIGEKFYTDIITLTNAGKDGLTITSIDLPQGVSTTLNTSTVNLRTYQTVDFQLAYSASMTSPAQGNVVLHTTGGDVSISLSASKQLVPDGYLLETFNDYFPPAGWRNNGFSWSTTAIEGDHSAYAGGDVSDTYLRSPKLDLTDGGKLIFTFYDEYNDYSDSGYGPDQDPCVQVSHDEGDTWTTIWTRDYQTQLNQLLTVTVDIPAGGEGQSYVRWLYPAVGYDSDEGAYDHSSFTLDRVLLPNVAGADGVPGNATVVSPANNATNVYPRDIVLQWGPAQFATGYKVYVGSNTEANNLIEGVNVGNALTYTIPSAGYETQYRWKVVPYNDKGENTQGPTWRFTTQPDASVMDFPWEETFDECTTQQPVPGGWLSTTTGEYAFAKWSPNSYYPYGGKGVCLSSGWLNANEAVTLTSPEFKLPAEGKSMSISFVWGNAHPRELIVDETGLLKKQNVEGGNGRDEVVFEIGCEGQWKQASYLSENVNEDGETKYWRPETIDLTEYAGKTVQFRWITRAFVTYAGYGTLDNVVINGTVEDGVAFNKEEWNAGSVNYGKAASSGDLLTMRNSGKNALKVKAVSFRTDNFTTSIAAGDEIAVGEGMVFSVTFHAKDAAKVVADQLTIEFEGGYTATFPVSGEGLAADVLYYSFEPNALDHEWKTDFTMIDADNRVNTELGYYLTVVENDGTRYAFTQVTNNNTYMLAARSGNHTIAAANPADGSAADDWLISKQLIPAAGATFDFYARNLGTENTVFIGDNDLHSVAVYVSEGANTKTDDFTVVMRQTEMPYLKENEWNHYTVDLSAYAGKPIYVALRHTTVNANALAFFDDFTFTHVADASDPTGIQAAQAAIGADAQVEVFNVNGVRVAQGRGQGILQSLDKGLYIVRSTTGSEVKTLRVVRK